MAELAEVTSAITGAVRAADAADAELVRRLRSIPVTVDRDQVAPLLPTAGTDPVAVHAWWRSLTPAQQLYLVAIEPARIQELDGIPADARDQAARILVRRHHWQIRATTARTDPIRLAARPSSLLGQLLGRVPRTLWFGTDPTDPSFGARVFSSNPGSPGRPVSTHVSYFDTGTPSVQNIAMIAMGDDTDVS